MQVTGESGVPASVIRHYSDVLGCARSQAVLAVEHCRQRALTFNKPHRPPAPLVLTHSVYIIYKLENAWQSLAYSPLGAVVSPRNEYL